MYISIDNDVELPREIVYKLEKQNENKRIFCANQSFIQSLLFKHLAHFSMVGDKITIFQMHNIKQWKPSKAKKKQLP